MIRLDERELCATARFGLSEVATPSDLVVFILLVKNISRVNVILYDDLATAVLQKFSPCG